MHGGCNDARKYLAEHGRKYTPESRMEMNNKCSFSILVINLLKKSKYK